MILHLVYDITNMREQFEQGQLISDSDQNYLVKIMVYAHDLQHFS